MIVNNIEFLLMNNPVRACIQDKIEAKRLRKLSSLSKNKYVLEIGCGNGIGTKLIMKYFAPQKVYATDLDKRMIELAIKKNTNPNIHFEIGDASNLQYENNQFDAIFDFGIIHHIPNWKDCLKELKRVLKFGGELIIEDLSIETFNTFSGKILKKLFKHPYDKMYNINEFIDYLKYLGFQIFKYKIYHPLFLLKYFVVIAEK